MLVKNIKVVIINCFYKKWCKIDVWCVKEDNFVLFWGFIYFNSVMLFVGMVCKLE